MAGLVTSFPPPPPPTTTAAAAATVTSGAASSGYIPTRLRLKLHEAHLPHLGLGSDEKSAAHAPAKKVESDAAAAGSGGSVAASGGDVADEKKEASYGVYAVVKFGGHEVSRTHICNQLNEPVWDVTVSKGLKTDLPQGSTSIARAVIVIELFLRSSMLSRDSMVGSLRVPFDQLDDQWRDLHTSSPRATTGRLRLCLEPHDGITSSNRPALVQSGALVEARRLLVPDVLPQFGEGGLGGRENRRSDRDSAGCDGLGMLGSLSHEEFVSIHRGVSHIPTSQANPEFVTKKSYPEDFSDDLLVTNLRLVVVPGGRGGGNGGGDSRPGATRPELLSIPIGTILEVKVSHSSGMSSAANSHTNNKKKRGGGAGAAAKGGEDGGVKNGAGISRLLLVLRDGHEVGLALRDPTAKDMLNNPGR